MMRALLFLSLLCLPFFSFADDYLDCDVNHDGEVNIADVNKIIDAILKGPSVTPPSSDSEMFTVNGVSFTMIKVEGGTFVMGATEEQGAYSGYAKALPIHNVNLSGYSIGQTEVTQELWIAVMGSNPSHFGSGYSNNLQRPVEKVSWNDCQTFINRLNELTGRQFHLPTEAQWEFAARGGNKSQGYRYSGSDDHNEVAWFHNNLPTTSTLSWDYGTQPVATKNPNELGIYDMSGNVDEWCQDWYDSYTISFPTDPTGPASGTYRVLRNGSYVCIYNDDLRVSYRVGVKPTNKYNHTGFRLAL